MLSTITKKLLEDKLEQEIRYHSDVEFLRTVIEKETKRRIGLNTLKRLFGYIDDIREPRLYTLDTIAIFLGHRNWDVYLSSLPQSDNSYLNSLHEIATDQLRGDMIIEFKYASDRMVKLRYIEDNLFKIIASQNSELAVGDIIKITQAPLSISRVIFTQSDEFFEKEYQNNM